ncbi:unnamed protein product, partial [Linum tenue]
RIREAMFFQIASDGWKKKLSYNASSVDPNMVRGIWGK